ncbi:MAG TPA: fused MFS/spermidine synthase [Candidatus Hydrogenedentes bacterium]|nr:fused MFS/spermidine synthase [Candidatus Hydrogenedentota bacterium]HOL75832.1 fused MFS/spermidine synthase [Candidatus Hydrogenedentota bacterium]HPO86333.1 fused MFS/spermidine synthase [Candidatus Hydrogenedentota bacterium]
MSREEPMRPSSGVRRWILYFVLLLFFVVSGACGLLYQVVWTRKLVLLFGTTAYAVSTVLFIFFLGLGVGSFWGGRLSERTKSPLALYGWFEIIIGLWALAFIVFVGLGESLVCTLLRMFSFSRPVGILLRGVLALAFLFVPTTLMGATLPLLSKFATHSRRLIALRVGGLYTANTFGAVAGCALAGFILLARFGYTRSVFIGTVANCLVGVGALILHRLSRAWDTDKPGESSASEVVSNEVETPALHAAWVVFAYAVCGFCALALEVLWTRLLVIVLVGTTYAFTTMLTALLSGLALGGMIGTLTADRTRRHVFWFGLLESLAGIGCIATLLLFAHAPERYEQMLFEAGRTWEAMTRAKFILSFTILFAPTFLFGMSFPFAVKAAAGFKGHWGRDVGILYGANTVGGLAGSLVGGFVLIPLLGTHYGILVLGALVCLVGVITGLVGSGKRPVYIALVVVVGAAALGIGFQASHGDVGKALTVSRMPKDNSLIKYQEGIEGTVAVSQEEAVTPCSNRVLWINGVQATASIERGVKMNRFQGALPLLFEVSPRNVLLMCFGSGITCGMLSIGPVEHIDAVEISKDVVDVSPLFAVDNLNVHENSKVRFIIDDGRNYLLTTSQQYDLITFEPMPLALAGVSTFYTKEYYELCLRRLTDRGIVSQWVPLHSLNPEIVKSLVRTFADVFPEYTAWFINADLFLIGSKVPLQVDFEAARERLRAAPVRDALAEVELEDPVELVTSFLLDKAAVDAFAGTGRIMTDDRPWAEFEAPKLMFQNTVADSLQAILPFWQRSQVPLSGLPVSLAEREQTVAALARRREARRIFFDGLMAFYSGPVGNPEQKFIEALRIDPDDRTSRYYLRMCVEKKTELHIRWESFDEGLEMVKQALEVAPDDAFLYLYEGDLRAAKGEIDAARQSYEQFRVKEGPQRLLEQRLRDLEAKGAVVSGGDSSP